MSKLPIDQRYSTTRCVFKVEPKKIIEFVEGSLGCEDKYETQIFLHPNTRRLGEGGLRTLGLFKFGGLINGREINRVDLQVNENHIAKSINTVEKNKSSSLQHASMYQVKPLITVITVVYNGRKYIEETILSVINQKYDNVEYIVIDGGSNDGTLDIIKKYEHAIDYWISEADTGIYEAMNKGVRLASGSFIGFLNADDFYEADALNIVVDSTTSEDIDIVSGSMNLIDINGNDKFIISNNRLEDIKKGMILFHPSTFVSNYVFKQVGLFDSSFKISGDYEFLLRAYNYGCKFQITDSLLVNFREGGISSNFSFVNLIENIRARRNNFVPMLNIREILMFFCFRIKVCIPLARFIKRIIKK